MIKEDSGHVVCYDRPHCISVCTSSHHYGDAVVSQQERQAVDIMPS